MTNLGLRKATRRQFLHGAYIWAAGMVAGSAAAGGYGYSVEVHSLEVSQITTEVPSVGRHFSGITIALMTDLHFLRDADLTYFHSVVDQVLRETPDVIALGGDYVSTPADSERRALQTIVSRLKAPLGVYAVLGIRDYDDRNGADSVIRALARGGATVLRNTNTPLRRDDNGLYLAGVDDVLEGQDDLASALARVPSGSSVILLAHEPDFADNVAGDERVVLQLSGHSHGGQVRIPGLPHLLPRLGRKYPEGLRRVGSLHLYTSRGIGVVDIPIRINCPPEIPIIRVLAA